MPSPPSFDSLKISDPAQTKQARILGSTDLPLSPSPSPPPNNGDLPDQGSVPNSVPVPRPEDTPPPTPSTTNASTPTSIDFARPTSHPQQDNVPPPLAATRPPPNLANIQSAPSVPHARPPPGRSGVAPMAGRGGMPMPMGMRGRGAAPQMQSRIPASLQAKMDKIVASRASAPPPQTGPGGPDPNATSMSALLRSQALGGSQSAQGPNAGPLGLAARRAAGGGPPRPTLGAMSSAPGGLSRPGGTLGGVAGRRIGPPGGLTLSGMKGAPKADDNKFTDFGKIMDPSGSLRFSKKAVLHSKGVDFEDGKSFKINMDEIEVVGELGRGNYGSVQQVYHRPTGVMMAMKEIRLELDESKLNGIIMELDILHRAVAPEIVEFYGAFTIESCVYYCMELMDAGSLDTLTGGGKPAKAGETEDGEEAVKMVPEPVLRRITVAIVKGLGFLKDELQIMHRDVKPTNVLINKKGEVKLVDFGVSGQLEKSLAKTNIGCQSYMAPERIKGESQNQLSTYTVSSDVWSVGLSIIELAKGCYPYPPETFANVFAQLSAIVNGPAPTLPKGYSDDAHDFVAKCLLKDPNARPTYGKLLEHPFLLADVGAEVDMVGWVAQALELRSARGVTPLVPVEA